MVRDHGGSGSRCPSTPRGRARTDRAGAGLSRPARPAGRGFAATAPGMKWVGDITYIPTWQGFAYLAVVMDCFSKKIIGHAIAGRMRAGLVTEASAMAVPGPSTDPWCHGPPLGSRGSMHVGRIHGIHDRPRDSPVRRADR
ncbi:MAG: DDE-type integrase/transposase/recombinase [Propionibacterium acidifaciens]|uniref:DDE-type integrase/transposase/recombinase n=1 Tax=Propionibacterium acidifaciens TaxID=556499 RepID=UPI0036150075